MEAVILPELCERLSEGARQVVEMPRDIGQADSVVLHEINDRALCPGHEFAHEMIRQLGCGKIHARADELYKEALRILHFQAVAALGIERDHGVVIRVVDPHRIGRPVDVQRRSLVDEVHLCRKGVPSAERKTVELTQNRQVFGAERVLSGPEFAHDRALAEKNRFLRLPHDKLRIGAQVGFREPVRKNTVALRVPVDKIYYCHSISPSRPYYGRLTAFRRYFSQIF